MPSKFKEIDDRPYRRIFRQNSITDAKRHASGGIAPRGRKLTADEPPPPVVTESRIGDEFQAKVPPAASVSSYDPAAVPDRPDTLLWSAAANPFSSSEMMSVMNKLLPLVGGPPSNPPDTLASRPESGTEIVLRVLHECDYSVDAAAERLSATKTNQRHLWTKAEERHFRSALVKCKKDLRQVQEAVKTKDLGSIVRYFYVDNGLRKKEEREKEREMAQMREARARDTSAARSAIGGGTEVASAGVALAPTMEMHDLTEDGDGEEGEAAGEVGGMALEVVDLTQDGDDGEEDESEL